MVMPSSELQVLVDEFKRAAIAHGRATLKGDSRSANRAYKLLDKAYKDIMSNGWLTLVVDSLLQDEDIAVRTWAATLVPVELRALAIPVLMKAAEDDSIFGFEASLVLDEWFRSE